MARTYKTGLIITGDAKGGIRAVRATEQELGKLNQGFDKGSKKAKQFTRNTGGASRELQVLRRAAAPVAAAVASMFALGSLRQQVDFADQLQKTNLRIGASTEALSQYNYVASLAGVQFNELTTAWQRQSRRVAQAAQDTGEAQDALATLGLDAKELAQLAPEDQFEAIAGAMSGVANEAQRVALAQKIWDSEGVKLLQIVNQGTDAIARQRAEAEALGLTISQKTAEDMAEFNDAMTRLSFAGKAASQVLITDLAPALTEGLQATTEFIQEMGGAEALLERAGQVAGTLATVYLARRLGPGLLTVGGQGLVMGRNIATGLAMAAGATGPLNRALVITQGRIAATAAAGRALTGAMGMLGGPAGVAMIAGGAMWYWHNSLVEAERKARDVTGAVADMTEGLYDLTAAELANRRAGLEAKLAEEKRAAAELEAQLDSLEQRAAREDVEFQGRPGAARVRASGVTGDGGQLERDLQAKEDAAKATKLALKELAEAEDALGKRSGGGGVGISNKAAEEAAKEAAKEAERLASAYQAIHDRIRPLQATQRQYAEDKATLVEYALRENMATRELEGLLSDLEQSYRSGKSVAESYGTSGEDAFKKMDNAADQFGATFSSRIEDAIVNFQSLGDVATSVLQDIQQMIVRQSITNPLGNAVAAGISGMFGGTAAQGGFTSQIGETAANGLATFGGGRLHGGPVSPGKIYEVTEDGRPEILVQGSKQYLLPGDTPGAVRPVSGPAPLPSGTGGGGGAQSPVTVQVIDQRSAGAAPQVQETRGPDGRRMIRVLIREEVRSALNSGAMDRDMANNFGIRRKGI